MIRHTKIQGTFKIAPEGYNLEETYQFNLIFMNQVFLFPCDDTPVVEYGSIHDFLLAFKEIKN